MLNRYYMRWCFEIDPNYSDAILIAADQIRRFRDGRGYLTSDRLGIRYTIQKQQRCAIRASDARSRGRKLDQRDTKSRIRSALIKAFPSIEQHELSSLVRAVMRSARHVRVDVDHPETHLAFSPDGVRSRDIKRRRSLTFAKFIRRKCAWVFQGKFELTDSMLDKASAGFRTVQVVNCELSIVDGQEAYDVYADENGISSCMAYGGCGGPEMIQHHLLANGGQDGKLKLVIAREKGTGTLAIRAKLWKNNDRDDDDDPLGGWFLDRIYWTSRVDLGEMTQTGNTEGNLRVWVTEFLTAAGYDVKGKLDCTLIHCAGEHMPYLDRCRKFDRVNDRSIRVWEGGEFTAENTDGIDESYEGSGRHCCDGCDERFNDDDLNSVNDRQYCHECYSYRFTYDEIAQDDIDSDDAVTAFRITRNGNRSEVTTHVDNCTRVIGGDWWFSDDVVDLYDGCYLPRNDENLVELSNGDFASLESHDVVHCEHDDTYELRRDCVQLHDGEYALKREAVELHDGTFALESDATELFDGRFAGPNDYVTDFVDDHGNLVTVLCEEMNAEYVTE